MTKSSRFWLYFRASLGAFGGAAIGTIVASRMRLGDITGPAVIAMSGAAAGAAVYTLTAPKDEPTAQQRLQDAADDVSSAANTAASAILDVL